MKLIAATIIGLVAFAATLYLLTRIQPQSLASSLKAPAPLELVTLLLNVLLLVIALVSLYVALEAFNYARQAGAEQQSSLDSSRQALESVVVTAQKQQQLLDESLKVAAAHFEVVRQQREDEIRRLAQKPKFEFALGSTPEGKLQKEQPIRVRVNQRAVVEFDLIVKNIGDATAHQPVLLASAQPASVGLSEHGQARRTSNANVLQIGGLAVMDMPPFHIAKTPYRYSIDAFVPEDVKAFSVVYKMWGDNALVHELTVDFEVIR